MDLFQIENVTFTYPNAAAPALDGLTLHVREGEFLTVCGKSGCGKSTLLRHLKPDLSPHGARSGEILFRGVPLHQLSRRDRASRIGFVMQNPDQQIVTDKVWHELAFGLESLGLDTDSIRLRVAEMASFFGIQDWFLRNVSELSGGQKQLLNLASVMAMHPDVLVLDEPTSQLDPIAAADFLETVKKVNGELGTAVILSEHRLEEVFPMSDRVLVMDGGRALLCCPPREAGQQLRQTEHDMFRAMPAPVQIHAALPDGACPLNVKEGRLYLNALFQDHAPSVTHVTPAALHRDASPRGGKKNPPMVEARGAHFRYGKDMPDVICGLDFQLHAGELCCIVGGNGTGKTTMLSLLAGLLQPYRGRVLLHGKDIAKYSVRERYRGNLGVVPQNPQSLFVKSTIGQDLLEMLSDSGLPSQEQAERVSHAAELMELTPLLQSHPYDVSGGEQQRAALAKILLLEPKILLLDEPTKGLDAHFKEKLASLLSRLKQRGVSILMVSHDVEFCARHADRCALFFGGNIVAQGPPQSFFPGNSFYTTSANRMSRQHFENAVTAEDVIALCQQNLNR